MDVAGSTTEGQQLQSEFPSGAFGNAPLANIDIFLRVKPVPRPTNRIVIDPLDGNVEFNIPKDTAAGLINNSKERYMFSFNGVLTPDAKQDEVFERVARPVVLTTLQGFNGTIFAYGQTGSGKTFTITGGAERYVERGIIPRTIACMYSEVAKHADYTFQVHISYLEIYNELGYDLLDPTREVQAMEDLPQVYIQEDEEQNIHFKNLSLHRASTEEEALNLLFLGDTNRTISETPMNQASSRSHCIFTIILEARRSGSDTVRRSKLHLVDLAGSERVAKTGVDGTTLKEAKYINLSLHYLEQVIVALQERSMGLSRTHVPYRNSLMTLVLRDSLGGNCKTVMVATASGEAQHMEESISTCRFAQRVAMVKNEVCVNEEVDPQAIIRRLKQEIRDLKDELQLAKGGAAQRGPLTPDELVRLRQQLMAFVTDADAAASLNLGGDMMMIRASWQVFKQLLLESQVGMTTGGNKHQHSSSMDAGSAAGSSTVVGGSGGGSRSNNDAGLTALQEQVRKLQLQVKQRDGEIAIMIGMLNSKGNGSYASSGSVDAAAAAAASPATAEQEPGSATAGTVAAVASAASSSSSIVGAGSDSTPVLSALLDTRLLADRHAAFEAFRKSYKQGGVIEDNKQLLKAKYEQAKALGAAVNASKAKISQHRAQIEQWRMQRSAACVAEGRDPLEELAQDDPRETQAKQQIEQEKVSYKGAFSQLRDLKGEIEHLQMLLEQSRQKLQRDFQQWLGLIARQQQEQQQQQQAAPQQHQEQHQCSNQQQARTPSGQLSSQVESTASQQHLGDKLPAAPPGNSRRPSSARAYGRSSSSSSSGILSGPASASDTASSDSTLLRAVSSRTHSSNNGSMLGGQGAGSLDWSSSGALARLPSRSHTLDCSTVDPQVLQAAAPHLTGNALADEDIIRFYEARAKLLQKLGQG